MDPNETQAVEPNIAQALDGVGTNVFRFVIEDIAFRIYGQTGDAELAAQDAVALTREAFRFERGTTNNDGTLVRPATTETLSGGTGNDDLAQAGDVDRPPKPEEIGKFFTERWDHDDEAFSADAAAFGLNPGRSLLLRDIL